MVDVLLRNGADFTIQEVQLVFSNLGSMGTITRIAQEGTR